MTMRPAASNMHKPCDMWSRASVMRRTFACARAQANAPAAMASNTPATQATTTEGNSAIDIVGASRSRTTIAVPSCGLVNKTPPPAVVSAE